VRHTRAVQRSLEDAFDCYRKTGKTRTYIDQCKALTGADTITRDGRASSELQRWTLKRLDDAFQGFSDAKDA